MDQPSDFDEARDCYESYYAAVAELRRRFLAERSAEPADGDCGSSSGGCS